MLLEAVRDRLTERTAGHAERLEDVLLNVVVVAQPRDIGDDQSGQLRAPVRVRGHVAVVEVPAGGRTNALRHVSDQRLHRVEQSRVAVENQIPDGTVLETGAVGHQVANRDRLTGVGVRHRELGEVGVDVGVQGNLALFHQLHQRRPGEQLADGAWAEQRGVRVHRAPVFAVGVAVTLRQQNRAILDDHDHAADRLLRAHLRRHHAVDEGLQFCGVLRPDARLFGLWRHARNGLVRVGAGEAAQGKRQPQAAREESCDMAGQSHRFLAPRPSSGTRFGDCSPGPPRCCWM